VRTLGHATWQESPTCDKYHKDGNFQNAIQAGASMYDYTPDFVYSSSIREAVSACYDYFQWNDYYSGGGNDFCECGWFDRNYHGGAMTASFAALNRYESCYWGAWGFPDGAGLRFHALAAAYGAGGGQNSWVNEGRTRTSEVLIIYPKDLLYCDERFGSWMAQYGYANYITADKFMTEANIYGNRLYAGNASYSAVVVAFEPFAGDAFIEKLENFAYAGGTVLWCSAFPVTENGAANAKWERLFGVKQTKTILAGETAKSVSFTGPFAGLPDMPVLTDFIVDKVYPVKCTDSEPAAFIKRKKTVGTLKYTGQGKACYMGCRLRDDQSKSTGEDISALFDVLYRLGAYKSETDTDYLARKSGTYFSKFGNGARAASAHTRDIAENWDGGFFRDKDRDAEAMQGRALPSMALIFDNKKVENDTVTYTGENVLFWRLYDAAGALEAFTGYKTSGIEINGVVYKFCDREIDLSFAPLHNERFPDGCGGGLWLYTTAGEITIPNTTMPASGAVCYLNVSGDGKALEKTGAQYTAAGGNVTFNIPDNLLGRQLVWLW